MKTEVQMKRVLFGCEIKQQSKTEYFSATDLVNAGNKWRQSEGLIGFNLSQYLKSKSFREFQAEVEKKHGVALKKSRGRNSATWVHPLLFIDIALAINPRLKVEVYDWLFDNLIKYRNESGDSYKEMAAAISVRYKNSREFPSYIKKVASYIKDQVGVEDWQTATEEQLRLRDKIHDSIKLLCKVLTDTDQAVRIGVAEIITKTK